MALLPPSLPLSSFQRLPRKRGEKVNFFFENLSLVPETRVPKEHFKLVFGSGTSDLAKIRPLKNRDPAITWKSSLYGNFHPYSDITIPCACATGAMRWRYHWHSGRDCNERKLGAHRSAPSNSVGAIGEHEVYVSPRETAFCVPPRFCGLVRKDFDTSG